MPTDLTPVKNAYEYRFLEDKIIPLAHPVGESMEEGPLNAPIGGCSILPAFCRQYTERSGREVIAIHTASGGTAISQWLPGMPLYRVAMNKITAGLERIKREYNVEHIYLVWLQGESDALNQLSEDKYIARLVYFKNVLKNKIGIEKFCLIRVGYFARTAPWVKEDPLIKMRWDEVIMDAQDRAVALDPDFVMLTRICKEISIDEENFNKKDIGHYNNASLERIGNEAGIALAELL